jgi:hypothetical protein
MADPCCAANDSIFRLPSLSNSPKAYSAPSVENKLRASANVTHPGSPGGNAAKERVSAASLVPSSLVASGGLSPVPNSFLKRLIPALHVQAQSLAIPAPARQLRSLAIFTAMRRASSLLSNLAADRRPGSSSKKEPRRDFSLAGLYSQRCRVCRILHRPFPEVRRSISRKQVKMKLAPGSPSGL